VGADHACARKTTGTLWCWGGNGKGQLGIGNNQNRNTPTQVSFLSGVKTIAAGSRNTCAYATGGPTGEGTYCWGDNASGQLGIGPSDESSTKSLPAKVTSTTPLGTVSQIALGAGSSCALNTANQLFCWGSNNRGQLGRPASSSPVRSPALVQLAGVRQVAAGYEFTCAAMTTGRVQCWGYNLNQALGRGPNVSSGFTTPTPGAVTQLSGVTDLDSSAVADPSFFYNFRSSYSCAVDGEGYVRCWGSPGDSANRLGDGERGVPNVDAPVFATTLQASGFTDVDASRSSSDQVPIRWLRAAEITQGKSDGTFGRSDTVTRSQLALFLHRIAGRPTAPSSCGFTDAGGNSPEARTAACWLRANGIVTWTSKFEPSRAVTREDTALLIWRFAKKPSFSTCNISDLSSVTVGDARTAVCWMAENRITTTPAFRPRDQVTRGEMASFLFRAFGRAN
jgi:hypothetical protein